MITSAQAHPNHQATKAAARKKQGHRNHMKADYDKVMSLMKMNNAKIKALQKEREEPPSNVALSLYDMIYMAKCYPGKINPGVWQDGLQPISALRLGTAERS